MKCKRCGYRANTIKGIGAHYRKKHPSVMRSKAKRSGSRRERSSRGGRAVFHITGGSLTGTLRC